MGGIAQYITRLRGRGGSNLIIVDESTPRADGWGGGGGGVGGSTPYPLKCHIH